MTADKWAALRERERYEIVYYEAVNQRWVFVPRIFDSRKAADVKANEIRLAGFEARVQEVKSS